MTSSKSDKSIARIVGKGIGRSLLTLLGLAHPAVGAGASAASGFFGAIAEERRNRMRAAEEHRSRLLFTDLSGRVEDIEDAQALDTERIDVFWSLAQHAIEDEEERKVPFYSAALEWFLRDEPPAAIVKQLSEAIRAATYVELYAFVDEELNGFRRFRRAIGDYYGGPSALHERLSSLGFTTNPSSRGPGHAHIRPIGKALLAHIDPDGLPVDLTEIQRGNDAVSRAIKRSGKDL